MSTMHSTAVTAAWCIAICLYQTYRRYNHLMPNENFCPNGHATSL